MLVKMYHNPREVEILTNIMNEKKPEKLPFKMTEEEEKYYQRALAEYEEMKKRIPARKYILSFRSVIETIVSIYAISPDAFPSVGA